MSSSVLHVCLVVRDYESALICQRAVLIQMRNRDEDVAGGQTEILIVQRRD